MTTKDCVTIPDQKTEVSEAQPPRNPEEGGHCPKTNDWCTQYRGKGCCVVDLKK